MKGLTPNNVGKHSSPKILPAAHPSVKMKGLTPNNLRKHISLKILPASHPSSALHVSILKSILLLKLPRTGSIFMPLEYCLPCDTRTNYVTLSNVCDTKNGYSICFKPYFDC